MNSAIKDAEKAKSLLNDEILQGAFTEIKDQCMKEWAKTSPDDVQRREDAWRMVKAVDKVKAVLAHYVNKGKFENDKITKLNQKKGMFR